MANEEDRERLRFLQLKRKRSKFLRPSGPQKGREALEAPGLAAGQQALETAIDVGAPTIGGTIGTLTGGGIPGGALGAAGGTAFGQLLKRGLGLEAPETGLEAAKEIGLSGLTDLAAGKAIKILGPQVAKILPKKRKFIESVTPSQAEAIETLEPTGKGLTLAGATENRAIDIMENASEQAFFGGKITRTKQEAEKAAIGLLDDFVEGFGNTLQRAEIKDVVQQGLGKREKIWTKAGGVLYKKLDDAITDRTAEIITKVPRASSIVDEFGKPVIVQETKKGVKFLDRIDIADLKKKAAKARKIMPKGTSVAVKRINETPDLATFQEAADLRGFLFAEAEIAPRQHNRKIVAAITDLASTTDNMMMQKGKDLPPEVLPLWDEARAFWRQGAKKFNNKLVQKILSKDPEGLIDTLIKTTEPIDIKAVRGALDTPEAWKAVQGRVLRRFMKPDVETGLVSGRQLLKELQKKGGLGDDVLKEFFPKGEMKEFSRFARTLATVQAGQPIGTGKMAIQLMQPGQAVVAIGILLGTGANPILPAAIVLGPAAMARVTSNKRIVDFIIKGSKGIRTLESAVKFSTRLSAQLTKEGIEHTMKEAQKPESQRQSFFESLLRGRNRSAEPRTQQKQMEERQEPRLTNALKNFNIANQ